MTPKWNYTGDINIEHGGLYWREDGSDDYVLAVKVTPCSDAGGPDNLFYIESGSIYIPDDYAKRLSALDMGGYTVNEAGKVVDCTGTVYDDATGRRVLVEMMDAYAGLDNRDEYVLQVGKSEYAEGDAPGWAPEADEVLRSNVNLRKYIEREYLF